MFQMTMSPQGASSTPQTLTLQFKKRDPIVINNKILKPATLLRQLNQLGEKQEIGRVDLGENRFAGFKSLGVDDTLGGRIFHNAHRVLSLTPD